LFVCVAYPLLQPLLRHLFNGRIVGAPLGGTFGSFEARLLDRKLRVGAQRLDSQAACLFTAKLPCAGDGALADSNTDVQAVSIGYQAFSFALRWLERAKAGIGEWHRPYLLLIRFG